MSAINELREQLAHTETAQFVTTMLRDISATRLQSIRAAYEANELYYSELHEKVQLLQTYAARRNISLPKDKSGKVYVALTSNRRFYGTLNVDVINKMRSVAIEEGVVSCVVIGHTGEQIMERMEPIKDRSFQYISFAKDEPTPEETKKVIDKLTTYADIEVVHPTYVNAFNQEAKLTDLTHVPDYADVAKASEIDYLFEPDIPEMLNFFKTQIRLVLFDRVVLETRLALTGARLMKMQRARERAEDILKSERRLIHKEIKTVQSMRLLETFTGYKNDNEL